MLELDILQRLALTKAARRGTVYHADLTSDGYIVFIRHFKDEHGLSIVIVSDEQEELARMPLDAWHNYCQSVAQAVAQEALAALKKPLVSAMSTQERALWLHSAKMWHVHTGITGRQAKRLAVYELKELDALQVYGKSLTSKKTPKVHKQDKPLRQVTHIKSKATSASSRILFAQKMDTQGKGRAILAKRTESTAPSVKIRKHN